MIVKETSPEGDSLVEEPLGSLKTQVNNEANSQAAASTEVQLRQTSAGPGCEFWNKLEQVLDS
jgi:hypothetical protein